MPLERDLIVFTRVAVELSRIEQWKISADHGFFSNAPLGACGAAAVKRPRQRA
jgi:SpoU rRNA methylase family enzyme